MHVDLQVEESFAPNLDPAWLEQAVAVTLEVVRPVITAETVTIVISDDEWVQQLNLEYRGIDAPTDVLSFENTPDPDFPEMGQEASDHLGDIIIAYPVAEAQALAAGHSTQAEVMLLVVHGLLHLLGFDHDTATRKAHMWATQQQVMTALGLAHVQPTES
jgi:probable rRNA maturation factor